MSNITWNEIEVFSPLVSGWKLYLLLGFVSLVSLVAFFVQKAIFRTLARLGSRHINQLIIPSQVKFNQIYFEISYKSFFIRLPIL